MITPIAHALRRFSLMLWAIVLSTRLGAVPAFPGAEGFGANASGGRGGTVYHVTNLNDSGPGSFREGVSVPGRTVVFDVGGIITINSPVSVKANITIAGQTAPGEGITLYGDRLSFTDANNSITRYLRVREGINGDSGTDAVGIASGDKMIFDHVSASWGRDETFSISGSPSNITLQDCIIGQGLLIHSAGGLMQTSGGVSIFRCLYIDNWMRNPKIKGVNDYQNNVIYNWGSGGGYIPAGDSAGLTFANMVGNYFIAGPNTGSEPPFKTGNANYSLYHAGNLEDLDRDGVLDGTAVSNASFATLTLVGSPFAYPAPATLLTAPRAYAHIVAHAGASLHRDRADAYMIAELTSVGLTGAHISNESEMGGVGTVAGGLVAPDSDGDGMPDWWESAAGTNPLVADHNGDRNADGYTNLENYINALAHGGVPAATIEGILSDTGPSTTDGITNNPLVILRGTAAPGAVVAVARADIGLIGSATADSLGRWTFDYSSTPLPDRYYAFTATVDLGVGQISPPTRAFVLRVDTVAAAAPVVTSLVLTPTVTLNGTSEPGSLVNVTLDGGGVVATAATDGLGNWAAPYTGMPLAPGSYAFTAVAVDLAGNPGPASAAYLVDTRLAAPVFTGITLDSGSSDTDRLTNDTTLVLNGTAEANATISVTRLGTGVVGTTASNSSGAWAFDYTGTSLAAGPHTFTATASNGGSSSPASVAFNVTVDTVRPGIASIRRQKPTTSATTVNSLVYRVTFAEPVVGVDLADFSLTLSGATAVLGSLTPVTASIYDITVNGATGDGTVRVDLRSSGTGIVDVAGKAVPGGYTAGQTYTVRLLGSGVWVSSDSGELYSQTANWEAGILASGVGATADFSALNVDGPVTVQLDSPRILGRLILGDTDFTEPALWLLSNNGSAANILTLAGNSPNIQVNAAVTTGDTVDVPAANAYPSTVDIVLAGSEGLTKTGVGTLLLTQPNTLSGPLTITKGIVEVGLGGSLAPSSVAIATSQQLRVSGGTFTTAGNVTWTSGTGTGIIVSGGVAHFQKIIPSNTRNSFFTVTGGTVTATDISFPRSGDSETQALAAGIFISGGDTTVETIGLGTVDSWGSLNISGGSLTVSGPLHVAYQRTSARGAVFTMSGGVFNSTDSSPTGGMIMSRNPGGTNANPNNVSKFIVTGGVSNIARLTLGFDSTASAGSAAVTLNNGEVYFGSGGIVKNGGPGLASSVTLTSGTLGALASWSTSHPLVVLGTPATLFFRAADRSGSPFDFTVTGGIAGAGGFSKTGAGTVTLGGANTLTGDVEINAGTLIVAGSLASGGSVTVNAGGSLGGSGTIQKPVILKGGTLAPDGTPALAALTWNSGRLAMRLGANGVSDRLSLSGALAKGTGGPYAIALLAGPGFAAGNTYTLASFTSSTFSGTDFVATGLPDGFGAVFALSATSLQVSIVAAPSVTSPVIAAGTYGVPFSYAITAANLPTTFAASGLPAGLQVDPATGVISGAPAQSGTFTVTVRASNAAGTGSKTVTFAIAKAGADVALGKLQQPYDGTQKMVTASTAPAGLEVTVTYNGSATAPTLPGTYAVVAVIQDPNYSGSVSGTATITVTALVRHAPVVNGAVDGSVQMLLGESMALSGVAWISGDWLVPGTPGVVVSGSASYGGTLDGTGLSSPDGYTLTLSGNAVLRHVVRRTDPIAMPMVEAPPTPAGTRTVSLTSPTQTAGDFATLRHLSVNLDAGLVVVPPGTYGNFSANGNGGFVLGVAGSTQPARYNFQSLSINMLPGNAQLHVVGPVIVTLANGSLINGASGSPAHPEWLTVAYASGGPTLSGNVTFNGHIVAPVGTVTLNGRVTLNGSVISDRLSINGNSILQDAAP